MSERDWTIPRGKFAYQKICRECGSYFLTPNDWSKICRSCWVASKKTTSDYKVGESTIPTDMLRRLIILCHPDKHNGSEMALKATQYLLNLREGK